MPDKNLTDKKIKEIRDAAIGASDSDDVWNKLAPLIKAQASNEIAADALIDVIRKGHLSINQSLDLLSEIFEAHKNNDDVVIRIGSVMDAACWHNATIDHEHKKSEEKHVVTGQHSCAS